MWQMAGPNGSYTEFTPERKAALLELLAQGHNLTVAAAKVGIHRRTAYLHRDNDPEFAQAISEAREAGIDQVEDWMLEKARSPSGFLANIAWLKAFRRERWGDKLDVTSRTTINIILAPAPTVDELKQADEGLIAPSYNVLPSASESMDDGDSTEHT